MAAIVRVKSIKIPNTILARAANKSAAHRALVNYALKHDLEPVLPSTGEEDSFALNLVGDLEAKLEQASRTRGIPLPVLFGALANAGLLATMKKEKREERINKTLTTSLSGALLIGNADTHRGPQKAFWECVSTGLYHDKIVMAEASTGVGKGRVIVSAAVLSIQQGKGPVIIAAPTIKVLSQLWAEFENDAVQAAAQDIRAAILPGQQEFVDEIALRDYLLDEPDAAVQSWLDAGGISQEGGAIARSGARCGRPLAWLMEDLRAIATNLRAEDFGLSGNSSKEGIAAQQMVDLRASVVNAQIVFCTHAMLAISLLNQWHSLPVLRPRDLEDSGEDKQHPVFLIDEAHLFETAVSNATSDSLSLYHLRHKLRVYQREHRLGARSVAGRAADIVRDVTDICSGARDEDRIDLSNNDGAGLRVREKILPLLSDLNEMMGKSRVFPEITGLADTRSAIRALVNALSGKSSNKSFLTFSPDRRFPSLQTGAASVARELGMLWAKASGGAALISASFYVTDPSGRLNCDHMRSTLALPLVRMDTPLPIVWDVIYSTPTLQIPSAETARALVPPTTELAMGDWCESQARIINLIAASAKGGTLVLCTAYRQIHALRDALQSTGLDPNRLVVHEGNIAAGQVSFVEKVHSSVRPVWLALGAAWTGLDLCESSDVAPSEDVILTDLVITRIPIGLNRSNTMISRMDRIGFRPVAQEALLTFKQGIGRLVRREHLTNRRIWILDGRLQHAPNRFLADIAAGVYSMLTKYKRRVFF